jgi:hypothetical protein
LDRRLTIALPKVDAGRNGKETPPMAIPTAVTSGQFRDDVGLRSDAQRPRRTEWR